MQYPFNAIEYAQIPVLIKNEPEDHEKGLFDILGLYRESERIIFRKAFKDNLLVGEKYLDANKVFPILSGDETKDAIMFQEVSYGAENFYKIYEQVKEAKRKDYLTKEQCKRAKKLVDDDSMAFFLETNRWPLIFANMNELKSRVSNFVKDFHIYPYFTKDTDDNIVKYIAQLAFPKMFNGSKLKYPYNLFFDIEDSGYYFFLVYFAYREIEEKALPELKNMIIDIFDSESGKIFKDYYENGKSVTTISKEHHLTTKNVRTALKNMIYRILDSTDWYSKYINKPGEVKNQEEQPVVEKKNTAVETVQNDEGEEEVHVELSVDILKLGKTLTNKLKSHGLSTIPEILEAYTNNDEDFTNISGFTENDHDKIVNAINQYSQELIGVYDSLDQDTELTTNDDIQNVIDSLYTDQEEKVEEQKPVVEEEKPKTQEVIVPKGYDDPRLVPDDNLVEELSKVGINDLKDLARYPRNYLLYISGMDMNHMNLLDYKMKQNNIKFCTNEQYIAQLRSRSTGMVTFYDLFVTGIITNASYSKIKHTGTLKDLEGTILDRIDNITPEGVQELTKVSEMFGIKVYTIKTYTKYLKSLEDKDITRDMIIKLVCANNELAKQTLYAISKTSLSEYKTLQDFKNMSYSNYKDAINNDELDKTDVSLIKSFIESMQRVLGFKFSMSIDVQSAQDVNYAREIESDKSMLKKIGLEHPSYEEVAKYISQKINIDYSKVSSEVDPSDIVKLFVDIVYYMPDVSDSILSRTEDSPSFQKAFDIITKSKIDIMSSLMTYLRTLNGFDYVAMVLFVKFIMYCKDYNDLDPLTRNHGITFD